MKQIALIVAVVLIGTCALFGQKGTAEPDYYPSGYSGETWTGTVTVVSEDTREFTLSYKKGQKEQTFVGVLAPGYKVKMKDGREHQIKMEELMGLKLRAYYISKNQKDANGNKVRVHNVFRIKFVPKD